MAFFKTDIPKTTIVLTGGAFIIGLLLVVVAQMMAFFTMAKRAESNELRYNEQAYRVAALTRPEHAVSADLSFAESRRRLTRSNQVRLAGLIIFVGSLFAFVAGCGLGAMAVVAAKDKIEKAGTHSGT